jgi:hypothetical protein
MNEIKSADANTGYGARGVPAFTCRFLTKESTLKRQNDKICRFVYICIYKRNNICRCNWITIEQNGKLT